MSMSSPDPRHDLTRRVTAAAPAFLDRRAGVIETARAVADLCGEIVPAWTNDSALLSIKEIVDQADGLPVGPVRELWSREALALRDPVIESIESSYQLELEEACRSLVERYR